jgi:penicillin-binding protein 1A
MLTTGIIAADVYDLAVKEELRLASNLQNSKRAPYFVDHIKKHLEEILGASQLYKSGLTIHTTLDFRLQQAAQDAVANGLLVLEARIQANGIQSEGPQAALVSLDVNSGAILAMVGGKNFDESSYNRATTARRQPGSAFKPIVYAYAVEHGFAQNKMILDSPIVFKGIGQDDKWRPQNFSKKFLGEISLRKALAISQNIPAVRLMEMLGPNSVARFAHSLGIEAKLDPNLSLALGTSEVTLLDITSAYTVFPRQGKWIEPFGVTEVTDHRGRIIWRAKTQKKLVMSREGAAIITDMLQGVIQEGTGRKARFLRGPIAGKTGTTNDYRDALFIGFSPSIATGVWTGLDSGGIMGEDETGARAALPIWIEFMEAAIATRSHQYFDLPDNVVKARINPDTGMLARSELEIGVDALFRMGTEPK